ncbi:hypothetical protein WR52_15940 [Bacillus cereus]|nr:hypothetical protein WR52_15940 [Bacillus cereus]
MNTVFIIVFWVLILFSLLNIILIKKWNISPIDLMGVFGNLKMLFTYSSIFYECKNSQNTQAVSHKNLHILGCLIVLLILLKLPVGSIPKTSADD